MTCDPWLMLRWWEWLLAGLGSGFGLGVMFVYLVALNTLRKKK